MQAFWGTYGFPTDGVHLETHIVPLMTRANVRWGYNQTIRAFGDFLVTSQANTTAIENAFRAAMGQNYQDFVFLDSNGNRTSEILINAGSVSGVRVIDGPHFTDNKPSEYATTRHFEVTFGAIFTVALIGPMIVDFRETLFAEGGGPENRCSRAVRGPHQIQQLFPSTEFHGTQVGHAVSLAPPYPSIPPCVFAGAIQTRAVKVTNFGPDLMGTKYLNYGTTWDYDVISLYPLVASPTLWPIYRGG
jgi:hypothetical protein